MNKPLAIIFFGLSALFVAAHMVAMNFALYWYFWWADIVMHTWGGVLIGLGIHVLASLPHTPVRATWPWLVAALLIATISWELFERYFGLFNPANYVIDTSMDIVLGFAGGLAAHFFLLKR